MVERCDVMTPAQIALAAYRSRNCESLKDRTLEANLFDRLKTLEETVDCIGPTPLRHRLSELIVKMRTEIWAFDQFKDL
jgi:hypothetical protein